MIGDLSTYVVMLFTHCQCTHCLVAALLPCVFICDAGLKLLPKAPKVQSSCEMSGLRYIIVDFHLWLYRAHGSGVVMVGHKCIAWLLAVLFSLEYRHT